MALTKVKLISDGIIVQGNLHASHGITTAHIGEGSNLYYTDARARAVISENSTQLSYNSSTGVLTYTQGDTDTVSEGSSNLYYTNARADARITNALVDEDNMASDSAIKLPSQQSVKAYVDTEVAGIVSSAPSTLDTLNELAAALGDDANFSTTVTNSIAAKMPLAGGTMTGDITFNNPVRSIKWVHTSGQSGSRAYAWQGEQGAYGRFALRSSNAADDTIDTNVLYFDNDLSATFAGSIGLNGTTPGDFNPDADNLIVGGGLGDVGITIYSGANVGDYGSIYFADGVGSSTASKAGYIRYEQNTSKMTIGINAVEKVAIDVSGNVGIGGAPVNNSGWAGLTLSGSTGGQIDFQDDGTTVGAIYNGTWGLGVSAYASKELRLYSGNSISLTLDTSQNATFAGAVTTQSGTSSIYNRLKITNNTDQINIGQWDGTNHRIEFDAGRPVLITSYNATGINLGISGGTTLNIASAGVTVTGTGTFSGNVDGGRFILPTTASAANQWVYTNNTSTGTGKLIIQSGAGSAAYGGGLILYSHSHASQPGWVKAGISSGSGGKFAVNTQGIGGGTDVFTVDTIGVMTAVQGKFSDNLYCSGGQVYFGALDGSTDNTYRMYVSSGQLITQSRESGTWTSRLTINDDGSVYTPGLFEAAGGLSAGYGTAGAPGFKFASDPHTGMYHISNDVIGFSTGGSLALTIANNDATFAGNMTVSSSSSKNVIVNSSDNASWRGLVIGGAGGTARAGMQLLPNTGEIKIGGYLGTNDEYPVIYSDNVACLTFGIGATPTATFGGGSVSMTHSTSHIYAAQFSSSATTLCLLFPMASNGAHFTGTFISDNWDQPCSFTLAIADKYSNATAIWAYGIKHFGNHGLDLIRYTYNSTDYVAIRMNSGSPTNREWLFTGNSSSFNPSPVAYNSANVVSVLYSIAN
jgi:hypothetical protein